MKCEIIDKEGQRHAVIPYEMYEQLLEDSEMLADLKAYDEAKVRGEESFPADIVDRITLEGANPLKVWREYRGLTQEQLAEAVAGVSRDDISEIESGGKVGSIKALNAIAAALNIDVDMII